MEKIDPAIGETIKLEDVEFVCFEDIDDQHGCWECDFESHHFCKLVQCQCSRRKDGIGAIFKFK